MRMGSARIIGECLCTGFSDGVSESMALAQGVNAFVQKPIAVERLAATIRRLLDRRGPTTGIATAGVG
jgi:DNA-binding response OmpR family regulator